MGEEKTCITEGNEKGRGGERVTVIHIAQDERRRKRNEEDFSGRVTMFKSFVESSATTNSSVWNGDALKALQMYYNVG